MRLFTAIAMEGPPLEGLKGFLAFAQGLDLPVKWAAPENIHLTLVFLGETREDQLTNLKAALKMATLGIRPFALEVGKLGAFPNPKKPKTLFTDIVKGREEVEGLFECMAVPLANAGFKLEERKFHPHVTLGKVREESLPLDMWERLRKACPPSLGSIGVEKLHLMESRLNPRGSVYRVVETYPLGT